MLWILRPVEDRPLNDDPWDPWYDKSFGFVVRADNEIDARNIAHQNACDENRGEFLGEKISRTTSPWLDEKYSSCVSLDHDGENGLVIRDFSSA